MRVIAKKMLREFWRRHPNTQAALEDWHHRTEKARWKTSREVKATFGRADALTIHGKNVIIFDIMGNRYRLIATVVYSTDQRLGVIYTREILTHREYDTNQWKERIG